MKKFFKGLIFTILFAANIGSLYFVYFFMQAFMKVDGCPPPGCLHNEAYLYLLSYAVVYPIILLISLITFCISAKKGKVVTPLIALLIPIALMVYAIVIAPHFGHH